MNLAIAALAGALLARRDRRLGLAAFAVGAGLVYLRGYLVPGTPQLTKRYLPDGVLAQFDQAPTKGTDVPADVAQRAADHALAATDGDETVAGIDPGGDGPDTAANESAAVPESLAGLSVEELLVELSVVEPCGDDDLCLTEAFREDWIEELEGLESEVDRREALASLFEEPVADVEVEYRDEDRPFGLVEGRSRHNWITDAALSADLAAHRVLEADERWAALAPRERFRLLKGCRVFLETCPECGGVVAPTDESVESCCRSWKVVAVRCTDCEARLVELPSPDERDPGGGAAFAGTGGFTR